MRRLFISERDNRVDTRCAARGQPHGKKCHKAQQERHSDEDERVPCFDTEQEARQQACHAERGANPYDDSHQRQAHALHDLLPFGQLLERTEPLKLDAEGVLANEEGIWRFTEIKLRPVVTILKEENRDKVLRLLEKAEKSCLIARSLQCKIVLFPAVRIEEALSVPAEV